MVLKENQARGIGQSLPTPSSANISTVIQQLGGATTPYQLSQQQSTNYPTNTALTPTAFIDSEAGKPAAHH